jgi:hypothetical protein
MNISFRITQDLLRQIHDDLSPPHSFAAERVAFISCGVASLPDKGMVLLAEKLHHIPDDYYIENPKAGATIGPHAFRMMLQFAYNTRVSIFHIHRHEHSGIPNFSSLDLFEASRFIPDFWKVRPEHPHGILVLSRDSITGLCWAPGKKLPIKISTFSIVGYPTIKIQEPV